MRGNLRQRDLDGAQATLGIFNIEGHGLAFVEQADVRRQIGTMDENIPCAVGADEESEALIFIEKLDRALETHLLVL
jgi:hypothetical protein